MVQLHLFSSLQYKLKLKMANMTTVPEFCMMATMLNLGFSWSHGPVSIIGLVLIYAYNLWSSSGHIFRRLYLISNWIKYSKYRVSM